MARLVAASLTILLTLIGQSPAEAAEVATCDIRANIASYDFHDDIGIHAIMLQGSASAECDSPHTFTVSPVIEKCTAPQSDGSDDVGACAPLMPGSAYPLWSTFPCVLTTSCFGFSTMPLPAPGYYRTRAVVTTDIFSYTVTSPTTYCATLFARCV